MTTKEAIAAMIEGTMWELVDDEYASILRQVLIGEISPGHHFESLIPRTRFVAYDTRCDDRLMIVEGSDVAAYCVHLTFLGRSSHIDFPWVSPLKTLDDVRQLLLGDP